MDTCSFSDLPGRSKRELKWVMRRPTDTWNRDEYYAKYPSRRCMKIHHRGVFTRFPGRQYVGGRVNYIELVDPDYFSVIDVDNMLSVIGYSKRAVMFYHYLIPGMDLDFGLRPLACDSDVRSFLTHIGPQREYDIFIELGTTNLLTTMLSPTKPKLLIREIEDTPLPPTTLLLEWYPSENNEDVDEFELGSAAVGNLDAVVDDTALEMDNCGVSEMVDGTHGSVQVSSNGEGNVEVGNLDNGVSEEVITMEVELEGHDMGMGDQVEGNDIELEENNNVGDVSYEVDNREHGMGMGDQVDGNATEVEGNNMGTEVEANCMGSGEQLEGNEYEVVGSNDTNVDVHVDHIQVDDMFIRQQEVHHYTGDEEALDSAIREEEAVDKARREEEAAERRRRQEEFYAEFGAPFPPTPEEQNVNANGFVTPTDEELNSLFDNFDPFDGDTWRPPAGNMDTPQTPNVRHVEPEAVVDESVDEEEDGDDAMVDNNNIFDNNAEVDMREFSRHIDTEVAEMCAGDEGRAQQDDPMEPELDDFYSADDEVDIDKVWKSNVKSVTKVARRLFMEDGKVKFYVGQVFPNKDVIKTAISQYSMENRRNVIAIKNDKTRMRVICRGTKSEGGESSGANSEKGKEATCGVKTVKGKERAGGAKAVKGKDAASGTTCPWVLYISKEKGVDTWMVKTYNDNHTCNQARSILYATALTLSHSLASTIASNPKIPIAAVREQLEHGLEIGVSRQKAFRAKQLAMKQIRGDYGRQYNRLRSYILELQRTNPNTTVKLDFEMNEPSASTTRQFKRIYICLGALKQGFRDGKRPLLGLDGTFMKGPYPGQILTAVGIDGNGGVYPVAYAVVESENYQSWFWFLDILADDLGLGEMSNFTFISDRQKGLIPAIKDLFPSAEHRYCLRHIHENMKGEGFKGEAMKVLLWNCASVTTTQEFAQAMEALKEYSLNGYRWLSKIPPKHWARSHFTGICHSDVLLNNISETFNRQLLDAREKPIIGTLEYIREYLMKRIAKVQAQINRSEGPLTPKAREELEAIKKAASKYRVIFNGSTMYQVSGPWGDQHIVEMNNRTCTCRVWELKGIPCKHAVATIWNMQQNNVVVATPEGFCHEVYWRATWKKMYSHKLAPVLGHKHWPVCMVPYSITPPVHHTQAGRPKKRRMKSLGEDDVSGRVTKLPRSGKTVTCDLCHQKGHNSRTYRGQGGTQSTTTRRTRVRTRGGLSTSGGQRRRVGSSANRGGNTAGAETTRDQQTMGSSRAGTSGGGTSRSGTRRAVASSCAEVPTPRPFTRATRGRASGEGPTQASAV